MSHDDADLRAAAAVAPQLVRVLDQLARQAGEPFLHRVVRVLPQQAGTLPYFLARYQPGMFAPALFARHGIVFPPHIRNSVAKRQAEFIAGRLCAQTMLAAYGHAQHAVAIGAHREPLWPAGYIGSITHNSLYAAAIACPQGRLLGVGIDIESLIQSDAREAMMALVVSAQEAALLRASAAAGGLDFDCLLTLVFSAKESFFKAAFAQVRTFFDFDALQLCSVDVPQRVLHFRCRVTLSAQLPAGRICQAHFDFLDHASVFTVVVLQHQASALAHAAIPDEAPRADHPTDQEPT